MLMHFFLSYDISLASYANRYMNNSTQRYELLRLSTLENIWLGYRIWNTEMLLRFLRKQK